MWKILIMEKYSDDGVSTKYINPDDIQAFSGLENETFIPFSISEGLNFPLRLSVCGITPPTPNYYIKRFPVKGFVLECIVEGKGYVVVNGNKHTVTKGDCYLLKMGENCEYYSDKKNPYKKLWVNFYGPFAHDIVTRYQLTDTVYKCDLTESFKKLFDLEKTSTILAAIHFKASAIITEMLLQLAESDTHPKDASDIAKQVAREILISVNKPFSLDNLSKKMFVSKSELIRHFKKSYGMPPHKYLMKLRISHAKNLLTEGAYTIKKIAEILDFCDQYYFSNKFKELVGISPQEYKKQHKLRP